MNNMLKDKVIVVTGGAGLIGQEFVKAIVEQGGIGILADINQENGESVLKKLRSELNSTKIVFMLLDITSKDSVELLIKNLSNKYGKIDGLVNNAYPRNKNYGRKFEDVTFEDFCENVNMHLGGYFLVSQQFAIFFKKQGFGNIVSVSSIYGVIPPRFDVYVGTTMTMPVEYAAIKSALIHLTKYMVKYYKGYNIRFNCLSPGGIIDKQQEKFVEKYNAYAQTIGMLKKADLKNSLVFLLSDMSNFITGQNLIVDDGFSL